MAVMLVLWRAALRQAQQSADQDKIDDAEQEVPLGAPARHVLHEVHAHLVARGAADEPAVDEVGHARLEPGDGGLLAAI